MSYGGPYHTPRSQRLRLELFRLKRLHRRYRPGQRRLRGVLQLACHVWIWMRYNGLMRFGALGLPWSSQSVSRDGRMRPGRRMADWAKAMAFANETAQIQCPRTDPRRTPISFTRCVATCMPRRHKCMTHLQSFALSRPCS